MINGAANTFREREHRADRAQIRGQPVKQGPCGAAKKSGRSYHGRLQTGGLTRDCMGLSRQRSSRKPRRCESAAARIDAGFGHQEVVARETAEGARDALAHRYGFVCRPAAAINRLYRI
jgi:hypothetical protein